MRECLTIAAKFASKSPDFVPEPASDLIHRVIDAPRCANIPQQRNRLVGEEHRGILAVEDREAARLVDMRYGEAVTLVVTHNPQRAASRATLASGEERCNHDTARSRYFVRSP